MPDFWSLRIAENGFSLEFIFEKRLNIICLAKNYGLNVIKQVFEVFNKTLWQAIQNISRGAGNEISGNPRYAYACKTERQERVAERDNRGGVNHIEQNNRTEIFLELKERADNIINTDRYARNCHETEKIDSFGGISLAEYSQYRPRAEE